VRDFVGTLSRYFVSGVLTLLPLGVTIGVLLWLYNFLSSWIGPTSPWGRVLVFLATQLSLPRLSLLVGAYILLVIAVIFIGGFVSSAARNNIGEWIKFVVSHLPGMGGIYGSVEQVVNIFVERDDHPAARATVVIARLANTSMLGLVTSRKVIEIDGKPHVMVYVPSAPVPMSGLNYLVPAEDVRVTDLRFEELVNVLVSLGAMAPRVLGEQLATQPLNSATEAITAVSESTDPQ
jgi:uncharacterized membrane protein